MKKEIFQKHYICRRMVYLLIYSVILIFSAKSGLSEDYVNTTSWPQSSQKRYLSVEDRTIFYEAIETVYWQHRIWPENNSRPKPSLNEMMTKGFTKKKVMDDLKKSYLLETRWGRPLTPYHLQKEIERLVRQTRQPQLLSDLFSALENDPLIIAECLARPLLADRLARKWYSRDEELHAELRIMAEQELDNYPNPEDLCHLYGRYFETHYEVADDSIMDEEYARKSAQGIKILHAKEWGNLLNRLAAEFNILNDEIMFNNTYDRNKVIADQLLERLPLCRISKILEDDACFYIDAVLEKSSHSLCLATVRWSKNRFDDWLANIPFESKAVSTFPEYSFFIPEFHSSCADDTWKNMNCICSWGSSIVWTGTEMIVWGAYIGEWLTYGFRYDPITDTWSPINRDGGPGVRSFCTTVWTGSEMIIWGGLCATGPHSSEECNTGFRYNPLTDSWTEISLDNAPQARQGHSAVWTGNEMIVCGGYISNKEWPDQGGRYNPATDTWTQMSIQDSPFPRERHSAVWTGSEMIIWGGNAVLKSSYELTNTGAAYNPNTDSWRILSTESAPSPRYEHSKIWTGSEMIIWGGRGDVKYDDLNSGGRYHPETDTWQPTSLENAPPPGEGFSIWTGLEVLIWARQVWPKGSLYSYLPDQDSWSEISTPMDIIGNIIWTGTEAIFWGTGIEYYGNQGWRYDPFNDSWIPMSIDNMAPLRRTEHTAVWTGVEMIIWGGDSRLGHIHVGNTGGRYFPSTDTWLPVSMIDVPDTRERHTAVWSGEEMIVWGGEHWTPPCCGGVSFGYPLNTGGCYNPVADTWRKPKMTNALHKRQGHSAVWTGREMIIWGGYYGPSTAGRYNPFTDSWTHMNMAGSPVGRGGHTAVWTGQEMIVWGGKYSYSLYYNCTDDYLNTGARYDPLLDTWTPINLTNSPAPRAYHVSAWTGRELIIWGGEQFWDNSLLEEERGFKYDPLNNEWTPVNIEGSPGWIEQRPGVWTGDEMLVWGDSASGRYHPPSDTWRSMSQENAPVSRYNYSAIWTGNEMIIWGGGHDGHISGGRYCSIWHHPYGDVNNDGTVDAIDSIVLGGLLTGNIFLRWLNDQDADLNENGKIDVIDLLILQYILVGSD